MDVAEDLAQFSCRLTRNDGSVWRVTRIEFVNGTPTVSGFPLGEDGQKRDPSAPASAWLTDEPLERGDRLVWVDAAGDKVWAFRVPLGTSPGGAARTEAVE